MRSVTVFYLVCKGGVLAVMYVKHENICFPPCSREEHKNYIPPGGRSP